MNNLSSHSYLALLRGINVGGNNIIKMADLRACFETMGFMEVRSYIQSGNVLFESDESDRISLSERIEKRLSDLYSYKSTVILVTGGQLASVVNNAPENFGTEPDLYRYDVLFLKEPLDAEDAIQSIPTRKGVDKVRKGEGVLYFSRLISRAGQSYLSNVVKLPLYKRLTIRNWNTTTRLFAMINK